MSKEEGELLCRVEGDAPMGRMMRRHWIPVCMSEEVAEPEGDPVQLRILGEELVVFRDSDGKLGLLDEHCPHRLASLAFGRNEEGGLRCLYHGWKFSVTGNVLEMPSEPAGSTLASRVNLRSYPVTESGGFVWAYMGEPGEMPEFRAPAWAQSAQTRISIAKLHTNANWAQVLEGAIDSAHSSSLHSSNIRPGKVERATAKDDHIARPSTDKAPRIETQVTDFGFQYAALRRPIKDGETHHYVRLTVYIAPFTVLVPPNTVFSPVQIIVPMDDHNTMFYTVGWSETAGMDVDAWRKRAGAQMGIDLHPDFRKKRNLANRFLQDRKSMKDGDFTGITGIPNQDMAMWESMGSIADRTREILGASDIAIVQFRRMMVDAVRKFAAGGEPVGGRFAGPYTALKSFEGVVPKTMDWRQLAGGARSGAPAEPAETQEA